MTTIDRELNAGSDRSLDSLGQWVQANRTGIWHWRVACAALCASAVGGLGGALLMGVGIATSPILETIGSTMLLSVIPFVFLGAHLLDRLERKRKASIRIVASDLGDATDGEAVEPEGQGRIPVGPTAVAGLGLVIALAAPARAQQTVFNVPSTDVLDRGKVYFELDATWKPVEPEFSSFVPRVVVGTGGRVEVGLNITGNIQPGADVTTLQPAFKWKVYDGGDNGIAVVVGDNISFPVRNKFYDVGNYAYAEVSKTFSKTGTRVTAGGYHFSENVVAAAQRAGGQFAVEQPVGRYVSLNADWFTGKHASGYFTPGIAFKPHPRVTGYFGYSIGNTGASNGNHFFYSAVGINLN